MHLLAGFTALASVICFVASMIYLSNFGNALKLIPEFYDIGMALSLFAISAMLMVVFNALNYLSKRK